VENPLLTSEDLEPFQRDAAREEFKKQLKAHDVRFQPTYKNRTIKMAVCTLCGKSPQGELFQSQVPYRHGLRDRSSTT